MSFPGMSGEAGSPGWSTPLAHPGAPFMRVVPGGESGLDPRVVQAMAPVIEFLGKHDPLGLVPAAVTVLQRAMSNPMALMSAYARLSQGMIQLQMAASAKAVGVQTEAVLPLERGDRRFSERTWQENPAFFALQQSYLLACRFAEDVLKAGSSGDDDDLDDRKAAFLVQLVTEAHLRVCRERSDLRKRYGVLADPIVSYGLPPA